MFTRRLLAVAVPAALLLAACGGDDDGGDATTTTTTEVAATTTAATTTTTVPDTTTTTAVELVTEGATVVVANASIVGGSAGRMTTQLDEAGFTTGEATNATEDLEDSVVHYTDADGAQEVAESLAAALGGVEATAMPDPVPTESGDLGGADVLLLLGNNQADQTLEELAGGGAVQLETAGSVVVVANASGVEGAAGRMSTQISRAGFQTGTATNAAEQITDSIVYFDPEADGADGDAELLADALGGLDVEELPDPVPTESGELDGDVLLLLGTNQADQSLASLNP